MNIGKYVIAAVGLLLVLLIGKYLRRRARRRRLLEITDEIRVTIAAQACMLLDLNR